MCEGERENLENVKEAVSSVFSPAGKRASNVVLIIMVNGHITKEIEKDGIE